MNTIIDESDCVLPFNHEGECMNHQMLIETCEGDKGTLGDPDYEEGYYFCAGCGAQFDDPDHGLTLKGVQG